MLLLLSAMYLWDGVSIALTIRSLDPLWGLGARGFWRFYTPSAPLGLLEAGAQCTPYKYTFQTGPNFCQLWFGIRPPEKLNF